MEPVPITEVEAARPIELAAQALIKDLIRLPRQAGRSWYEIGEGLDLHWQTVVAKEPIAEVAYDYVLEYQAGKGIQTFNWTCPACQQLVTDQSPFCELPAQQEGHADNCARWATELAGWKLHQATSGIVSLPVPPVVVGLRLPGQHNRRDDSYRLPAATCSRPRGGLSQGIGHLRLVTAGVLGARLWCEQRAASSEQRASLSHIYDPPPSIRKTMSMTLALV